LKFPILKACNFYQLCGMLAFYGLFTIGILLFLVISKKASPVVALILVPLITAMAAGFGSELSAMVGEGLKGIAPTAVMFVFAILFFGVLLDAGTFEPIISRTLKIAGNDPVKITVATALLAMIVHLDGSGATTFLIVIPALLPVYDAMGMKRLTLATIVALAAGTMNILPWGGPTIRAAASLKVEVMDLFFPLMIPVIIGLFTVMGIAFYLGKKEKKRLGIQLKNPADVSVAPEKDKNLIRPKLFFLNLALILVAITTMMAAWAPPYVVFMLAFAIAITINYPKMEEQRQRIDAHAKAALLMASILFGAGVFTGVLKGTGMMDAMATGIAAVLPQQLGIQLPLITGILAMPASLLFDPDSFYFGMLPLLASTAETFGSPGIQVGQAAILGQMTTGFAVSPLTGSTFLLIGLAGVELGEHQLKTIPWAFLITLVMLSVSILMGIIIV
jgi:CitMHS family citrate-Mg2+:H+ or citrate-Ca2+:H+ symporter